MTEAMLSGLVMVFQWPALGFLILGVSAGIVLGAIPGLGGIMGLILLLPFTFSMDPVSAFALLLGMFAVTTTSDSISSILLGIPGTSASQATILDGHPMALKGQAHRAFGAAYTVSAFGGVFGALMLALSLPFIVPVLNAFRTPELLMLSILALTMVGSLAGRDKYKGLIVACLGLLLSTVGYGEMIAVPRYTLGTDYLLDGLPLVPAVLGFFAIPELLDLATREVSISRVPRDKAKDGGMKEGVKDAFRNWWLAVRCSVIGTYIGILPGLGGSIADWVAYGYATRVAKDKSQFGKGDVRGVIAPEAANNATKGGALIPTIAFGIPGSLGAAILLGALLIQGLKPGPEMLTVNLDITFSMIWSIVIANILAALLLMALTQQVAKAAFLPGHYVVAGVIVFVFMGAWQGQSDMGDWIACLLMGVLGYAMKRAGWPRPPLILALILGGLLENFAVITMQAYSGASFISRPIVIILVILLVFTIAQTVLRSSKARRSGETTTAIDEGEPDPLFSFALSGFFFLLFGICGAIAMGWQTRLGLMPLSVCIVGLVLVLTVTIRDVGRARAQIVSVDTFRASRDPLLTRSLLFLGMLAAVVVGGFAVGQKIALVGFVIVYLRFWARQSWIVTLLYAAAAWLVLAAFYDRLLNTFWHVSWLERVLGDLLPHGFPAWLLF